MAFRMKTTTSQPKPPLAAPAAPAPFDSERLLRRVTVYRVLDRLVEAGLCDRRVGADRVNRFSRHVEAASGNTFECDQCHKVLALPSDPELPKVMGRLGKALRKQGIDTRNTALTLHGTCGECAR